MTIGGALSELNNLLKADDIPIYYKPSIKAVMDTVVLSNSENSNRWIPVSERLPEEGKEVLITILWKDGIRTIEKSALFDCTLWKGFGRDINVTAWMPLPKPYKGESEE